MGVRSVWDTSDGADAAFMPDGALGQEMRVPFTAHKILCLVHFRSTEGEVRTYHQPLTLVAT